MFHSSWNSAAFQEFCGQVAIVQNGDGGPWVLTNTETGDVFPDTFPTRERAEEARRQLYDGTYRSAR